MRDDPGGHSTFTRANVEILRDFHIGRYVARSQQIGTEGIEGSSMQSEVTTEVGSTVWQDIELMTVLESRKQALYEYALALVDEWWGEYLAEKKTRQKSDRGYLGLRVRQFEATLSIEYFRSVFKKGSGAGGSKPMLRTIPRGSRLTYTEARLRKEGARPWEIELVMAWEPTFEVVRKESLCIGKLFRYARDLERIQQAREGGVAVPASPQGLA
jgi:hypothetical protein